MAEKKKLATYAHLKLVLFQNNDTMPLARKSVKVNEVDGKNMRKWREFDMKLPLGKAKALLSDSQVHNPNKMFSADSWEVIEMEKQMLQLLMSMGKKASSGLREYFDDNVLNKFRSLDKHIWYAVQMNEVKNEKVRKSIGKVPDWEGRNMKVESKLTPYYDSISDAVCPNVLDAKDNECWLNLLCEYVTRCSFKRADFRSKLIKDACSHIDGKTKAKLNKKRLDKQFKIKTEDIEWNSDLVKEVFFKKHKIEFYLLDPKSACLDSYKPEGKRDKHKPICYVVKKGNHVCLASQSVAHHFQNTKPEQSNFDMHLKVSNRYFTPKDVEEDETLSEKLLQTQDVRLLHDREEVYEAIRDFKEGHLTIVFSGELQKLYLCLRRDMQLDFEYLFTGCEMTHLYFGCVKGIKIAIRHLEFTAESCETPLAQLHFADAPEYLRYHTALNHITRNVLRESYKSQYSQSVQDMFEWYPGRANLYGSVDEEALNAPLDEIYEIDFVKLYPTILREMEKTGVPRFTINDEWQWFDNHPIEDYTNYLVQNTNNETIYGGASILRCWGKNLKINDTLESGMQYKVLAFVRPSIICKDKLFTKYTKELLKHKLCEAQTKQILNSTIGMLSKVANTKSMAQFFKDKATAHMWEQLVEEKEHEAFVEPVSALDKEEMRNSSPEHREANLYHRIRSQGSVRMVDGFYPIGDMVWDTSRIHLKRLVEAVTKKTIEKKVVSHETAFWGTVSKTVTEQEHSFPILAVNTDAVFVRVADLLEQKKLTEIMRKTFGLRKSAFNFGSVKISPLTEGKHERILKYDNVGKKATTHQTALRSYKEIVTNKVQKTQFKLQDEFEPTETDWDKMMTAIEDNRCLRFVASKAGCGKTYTAMQLAERLTEKEKVAVLCAWNAQKQEFVAKYYFSKTCFGWFGMQMHDVSAKRDGFEGFDVIVFDEINLNDVKMLNVIKKYMCAHPDKFYICTGDSYQCDPIDPTFNNVGRLADYVDGLISDMFPVSVKLEVVKRACCEKHPSGFNRKCGECIAVQAEFNRITDIPLNCMKKGESVKQCIEAIMCDEGIRKTKIKPFTDKNVCYYNTTRTHVNRMNHYKRHENDIEINQQFCCIQQVTKSSRTVINKREFVTVHSFTTYEGEAQVIVSFGENKLPIFKADFFKHFDYDYCATAHGYQGRSESCEMCVYDLVGNPHIGLGAIYVQLSRTRNPRDTVIYDGEPIRHTIDWNSAIASHLLADANAGRRIREKECITPDIVEQMLINQHYKCEICKDIMDVPSINRWDNDKPHTTENCRMSCVTCNKSVKNTERVY